MRIVNLTDRRFGLLTVLQQAGLQSGNAYWQCQCQCGRIHYARTDLLRRGGVKSCGCSPRARTHGMKTSRIYMIWTAMKQRCYNPRNKRFADYGGRGIIVCPQWRTSFENFYASMGSPPPKHVLDRIDNNGHYSANNCRWATYTESAVNRRPRRLNE